MGDEWFVLAGDVSAGGDGWFEDLGWDVFVVVGEDDEHPVVFSWFAGEFLFGDEWFSDGCPFFFEVFFFGVDASVSLAVWFVDVDDVGAFGLVVSVEGWDVVFGGCGGLGDAVEFLDDGV